MVSLRSQFGFSLVELSIVLVILGLLTGGILGGQALIRAAELRAVPAELARHTTAVQSFRDKYFALPGDMINATAFWGVRAGTGSDVACHQTINTTTGTCNGNGDGRIDFVAGDATFGERFLGWQHLVRAGLIEGNYTGASGSASTEVRVRVTNLPPMKLPNTQVHFWFAPGPQTSNIQYFDGPYSHNTFGVTNSSGYPLSPEEAWNIDTKLDDGRPATGRLFTFKNTSTWTPGCATTDLVATAQYTLNNQAKICDTNMRID
jgi:prepilin-type N-terminal cleavage/methylation domain-containing protein